jgi:hypothetical protein
MRVLITASVCLLVLLALLAFGSSDNHVLYELPAHQQASLYGGLSWFEDCQDTSYDCAFYYGVTCIIYAGNQNYYDPSQCSLGSATCVDSTLEEVCVDVGHCTLAPCVYQPDMMNDTCDPEKAMNGWCDGSTGLCDGTGPDLGDCSNSVDQCWG